MAASVIKKVKTFFKITKGELRYYCIKICLIYIVIGFLWVYFSDKLTNKLAASNETALIINTYKGLLFVIFTAIIIYLLINSLLNKVELSEARNNAIVKAIPDLLFVVNSDGYFIDCMASDESLLIIPRENFIGRLIWQVIPQEIAEVAYEKMQIVLKTGVSDSFEYKLKVNGKDLYFELRMVKSNEKEVLAISRDVTVTRQNEKELKMSEEKYKALVNEMQQGLVLFERSFDYKNELTKYILLDANVSYEKSTGLKRKDILGKTIIEIFPNMKKSLVEKIENVAVTGDSLHYERFMQEKGRYYDAIAYRPKKFQVAVIVTDITDRKNMENKMKYLSYHDQLTGLYNRRFFEEQLIKLDIKENLPLTIIMSDVNGLKLINDSFGHAKGDELLKKVVRVLIKGCNDSGTIARLGGDEFVILLPQTDMPTAQNIIKNIKNLALKEKVDVIDISISFGYAVKNNEEEKIEEVLKKAEDYMYKEKLFEGPSMRGKTVTAIISALHEKNKREEQHSHRVSLLCESMGKVLGLPEGEIQELKTIGLLHDIGKIAIEENILNKNGKLTNDEWEEIKRHPEIGYRILSTVDNMLEVAEYVLNHHERWDGAGYPKGLKGEEIPLQSRIISIADSYDAMTSERSYRRPMPEKVAVEQLKMNAGTQFDPKLVKLFIEKVLQHS